VGGAAAPAPRGGRGADRPPEPRAPPERLPHPLRALPACQGVNPKLELGNEVNPKLPMSQPQSPAPATPNSPQPNPKLAEGPTARLARIEPRKEFKELKEKKEGATPNFASEGMDKPETRSPFWCPAHGYCHGERQPDHRPDCCLEAGVWPEGTP
jgi:hypothetical protein